MPQFFENFTILSFTMAVGAHMRSYSYMYCASHRDGVLHAFYCEVPPFISLQVGPTHRYCYCRSQQPFSFASMRARTHDPKGLLQKWGALSLPTELAHLVVRVLPTSVRVPLGRGFELSWRRKKRAVGTCSNSTYEWDPPEER